MPGQRKEGLKHFGGHSEDKFVEKIREAAGDDKAAYELGGLVVLLTDRRITAAEIRKMADHGRIDAMTVTRLERLGLLK